MNITAIAFVGHPITDLARARRFYETVLGLRETLCHPLDQTGDQFWIEYDVGAEHCLAISNVWEPAGQPGGPTVALEVDDLDRAYAELESAGAVDPEMPGIMESPVCRYCFALDPDRNPLMLHQRKRTSVEE
ncbi:MAG: VOC family protein [Verrucomicrobiota bacterium]